MPQIVDLKNDRSISTNEEVVSAIQLARSFRYKAQTLTLHLREREKQRELVRPDIHGDYTLKNNKEYLITGEDMDPDQPNQDLSLVSLTARKRSVVALGDFEIKTICDGIPAQFDNMPFNLIILQAMIAEHVVMLKRVVTDERFVDRSLISEAKPENTFKYIQNKNSLECATSEIVMGIIDCMAGGRSKMMLIASEAAITRNIFDSFILHQDDIARKADCLSLKVAVEQMIDICMEEKDNFRAVYDKLLEFTQAVIGIVSSCSSEMKDFEKQSKQMEKNWERKRQEQKTLLESFTAETDKLLKAMKEKDRADDMIKGKARGLIARLMAAIMNPQKRLKKSMEKAEKKHKAVEAKILERQKKFEEATGLEKLIKGLFMKKNSLEGFTGIVVSMKSALNFLVNNWHSQCEYFALLKNLLKVLEIDTVMITAKQELGADYTKNMLSMTGNCRAVIAAAVMSNKVYDEYTLKILAGDNEAIDKIRDTKERKKVEEMIQEEKAKSCAIAIKDVKDLAEQMSKVHD